MLISLTDDSANLTTLMAGANAIQVVDFDGSGGVVNTVYDFSDATIRSNFSTIVSRAVDSGSSAIPITSRITGTSSELANLTTTAARQDAITLTVEDNIAVSAVSGLKAKTYIAGNGTISYSITDSASNVHSDITGNSSAHVSNIAITIDDTNHAAGNATELNAISSAASSLSYAKFKDTASNVHTYRASLIKDNVAVTVDDTAGDAEKLNTTQLNNIQAQVALKSGASLQYTKLHDSYSSLSDTSITGTNRDDLNGINVTYSDTSLTAQQFGILLTAATRNGASGTVSGAVVDTPSALESITLGANTTSITAAVSADGEDLTGLDLDSDVTAINLNGKSGVILDMGNIGTRSITAGGGTYVVRDAATNLTDIDLTAAPNNNPNAASVTAVVAATSAVMMSCFNARMPSFIQTVRRHVFSLQTAARLRPDRGKRLLRVLWILSS